LTFSACAAGSRPPAAAAPAPGIPAWVKSVPIDSKGVYVYALGYSPRTFYTKDAFEHAKAAARVELAKNIRVTVKETLTDTMVNSRRAAGGREELVSVSESTLDEELKGSEIAELWQDADGLAGEAGAVYALARVKHSSLRK
jgi:hypothetical protein